MGTYIKECESTEAKFYDILSGLDICPKVHKILVYGDKYYVEMDRYPINNIINFDNYIVKEVQNKIKKMHYNGILWVDNNKTNIVMDFDGNVKLIDFEYSINIENYTEDLGYEWYDEKLSLEEFMQYEIDEIQSYIII